jgi:hypothetical protein
MTTNPESFEYDYERSRAAVAVACLQWLRCTGPTTEWDGTPEVASEVDSLPAIEWLEDVASPIGSPHPLWDRWLDG